MIKNMKFWKKYIIDKIKSYNENIFSLLLLLDKSDFIQYHKNSKLKTIILII